MERDLMYIYDYLVDHKICTKEEIDLVMAINGYTMETINDIIYARTSCVGIKQLEEDDCV